MDAEKRPAVNPAGMVRVRVHTRSGNGRKTAMVGLITRETLDEIRERFIEASLAEERCCHLSARLKSLEVVEVVEAGGEERIEGRRVLLGVTVRDVGRRARVLEEELEELILEAERIKETGERQLEESR